jgi:hypothetical protein
MKRRENAITLRDAGPVPFAIFSLAHQRRIAPRAIRASKRKAMLKKARETRSSYR